MAGCLIDSIQRFVAITSVGASTVRGSPKGTADAARAFLSELRLQQFGVKRKLVFCQRLDEATEELRKALPEERQDWALARKLLNIFLRHAFYNRYLRDQYRLDKAESFFEVPVDSVVAEGLHEKFPKELDRWSSLKKLTEDEHTRYQSCAEKLACTWKIARVHLDLVLWVQGR